MAKLKVYNLEKKEVGEIELADSLVNTELKPGLIKDSIVAYQAAIRQGTLGTKTTSKVSGSTRKLYKQKGTGNARAGSVKGVQRRHGATQFGPQMRSFAVKMNKKANRAAIDSVIADLIKNNKLSIVDIFKLESAKATKMKAILENWQVNSLLIVIDELPELNFLMASRNFKNIKLTAVEAINSYDLYKYNHVFFSSQAIKNFSEELKNE